jgi:hypothetical protein
VRVPFSGSSILSDRDIFEEEMISWRSILFLVLFLAALPAGEGFSGAPAECRPIAGLWQGSYQGLGCSGKKEKGNLTLQINRDCSFHLQRDIFLPILGSLFVEGSSITFADNEVTITVHLRLMECDKLILHGSLEEDGRVMKGDYEYENGERGTFTFTKKNSSSSR